MPFSTNSMGFGAGPSGIGPFGHGPWVTCPFTSQVTQNEGYTYNLSAVLFEDLTEQRLLRGRQRATNIEIDMTYADSSRVTQVRSFFRAAGGMFTRFIVGNFRTRQGYVARFVSPSLPVAFNAGATWRLEPLNCRVEMNYPYADMVRADSAMLYWRLDLSASQNTGTNCTIINSRAGAQFDLLPHLTPHSLMTRLPGGLDQDFNTAIGSTAAASAYLYMPLSMMSIGQNFSITGWMKTTQTTKGAMASMLNGSGHMFFGIGSGGTGYFEITATTSTTVVGSVNLADGSYHFLAGVRHQSSAYLSLYVDGSLVQSRADVSGTVGIANPLWIGVYGGTSYVAGFNFQGNIDDVAIYGYPLTAEIVTRHWRMGSGID